MDYPKCDEESSVDSGTRQASDLRLDKSHAVVGTKSTEKRDNGASDKAESKDVALQVEPFPFSHVTCDERRHIEIQVGETLIAESRLNQLRRGDVVKLDVSIDEDVVVWCDGRRIARGNLVVANGRLAVLLAESPNLGGRNT